LTDGLGDPGSRLTSTRLECRLTPSGFPPGGPPPEPEDSEACSLAVTPTTGCAPAPPASARLAFSSPAVPRQLPWSFSSLRRLSTRAPDSAAASPSRAVLRVSHPLDGLSLPGTFGLVSCRNAHGIFALQGFSPTIRPTGSSPVGYPLGVLSSGPSLGLATGSEAPRPVSSTAEDLSVAPSRLCSDGGSVSTSARFRRPSDRSPPELCPL
jgi:hypothetical protein